MTASKTALKPLTLLIDRTNSSGVNFKTIETRTLPEWCSYFGVKSNNPRTLLSRVNNKYLERYAACYRMCCYVTQVDPQPDSQRVFRDGVEVVNRPDHTEVPTVEGSHA